MKKLIKKVSSISLLKSLTFIIYYTFFFQAGAQNLEQLFGSKKVVEKDLWEKSRLDYYLSESNESLLSPKSFFYQGNTKLRNGLYEEAITDYKNAITHDDFPIPTLPGTNDDPSNAKAYMNISLCFQLLHNSDSALHYCQLVIQENKYYLDAYLRTVEILSDKNNFNDANRFLAAAMDVFPESKKLYFTQAQIYSIQGKISKTKRYLKKAIHIDPEYDDANIFLASVYILEYNIDGAMRILTKSINAGKKPITPLYYRAIIYREMGEEMKAYNDLNRAYLLDTIDNPVTSWLLLLDYYYENYTRADKLWQALQKTNLAKDSTYFKKSNYAHIELCGLMDYNHDSITANKENIDVLNSFTTQVLHGETDEAMEAVVEFMEANPFSIYAKRLYGFAYFVNHSDDSFFNFEFARTRNFTDEINMLSLVKDHTELYNIIDKVLLYDSTLIGQYISKASFQFSCGYFNDAIHTTNSAIAIDSMYLSPYQLRVSSNLGVKNYLAAIPDLRRLIELSNDFGSYASLLAYSLYKSGDYEEALETNTKILEYYPEELMSKYNQGLCYEMTGQLDSALVYFKTVGRSLPSKSEYTRAIARVYKKKGEYKSALLVYKDAASREYYDKMLLVDIADLYFEMENYDEALYYYKKSYKESKNYTYGYLGAANCYSLKEDYDKAIPLYEKAIKLIPDHAYSHYALGLCFAKQKKFTESNKAAFEATKLYKEYPEAYLLMSQNFFYLKRYSVSVSMGLTALGYEPANKEVMYQIAASTLAKGNFEEALDFYQRLVDAEETIKSDAYPKAIETLRFLILFDVQADNARLILTTVFGESE